MKKGNILNEVQASSQGQAQFPSGTRQNPLDLTVFVNTVFCPTKNFAVSLSFKLKIC